MHYNNLTLIGSSHVSADSVKLVRETIEKEKPSIIALELDKDRLEALLHKGKRKLFIRGVGIKGMLFAAIVGWIETKIGKVVNVELGSEMKTAVNLAKEHNIKIALIDQHITKTLKRFSESITWKEKWNFVIDILLGIVAPKKQMKKYKLKDTDLSKVPDKETIRKILEHTKERYPNFYKVIVAERNEVMANNIAHLILRYPDDKILAVIGAGHEEEMMKLIREKLYKHSKE